MYNINRRRFLQFAASTVATVGASQLDLIQRQGTQYGKVLAQSTSRKIALLVGINQYDDGLPQLQGCVNDVNLQKELLVYRFGFNPKDILIVTDAQATRQGILTAFEEHLIKQAKPNDVVVFHYSGHGDRVSDKPSCDEIALGLSKECANSSFCPVDARAQGNVRDIMGHTLFLLMSALQTENFTAVLDSCHSGGGKRGNYRVRSAPQPDSGLPTPFAEELQYQQQWLSKLKLSPQEFVNRRRQSIAKGVVIAAGQREQEVLDATFDGFSAGAFTYLFTQYLWQQIGNESLARTLINVSRSTKNYAYNERRSSQDPEYEISSKLKSANPKMYFSDFSATSADAVITKVNGNDVELWLGGVDAKTLEAFQKDSIFTGVGTKGAEQVLVQLNSRDGLIGRGKLIAATGARAANSLQPGALLQERIRGINNNITLKIGLDDTTLDSNLISQAKQSFQSINRVEALSLGTTEVQYVFGKMTDKRQQELQKNRIPDLPSVGSFGLFVPTTLGIIPGSFGASTETVSAAVTRLQSKLKLLLAARIVRGMLGNTNTSRVKVSANMTLANGNKVVGETFTVRGGGQAAKPVQTSELGIQKLPIGTQIAFQVRNDESSPLYVCILVIDAAGEMAIIYPNDFSASEGAALLGAGQKLIIPQTGVDEFKLTVSKPSGFTEALIIASTAPLRDSLKALKNIASRGGQKRGPFNVGEYEILDITDNLLKDLDTETRGGITASGITLPAGVRGVDAQKLAAMSITFEAV